MLAKGIRVSFVFAVTPPDDLGEHVFYRLLLDRVKQMPGLESVSMVRNRPGTGWAAHEKSL